MTKISDDAVQDEQIKTLKENLANHERHCDERSNKVWSKLDELSTGQAGIIAKLKAYQWFVGVGIGLLGVLSPLIAVFLAHLLK